MAGFVIRGVETSGSAAKELKNYEIRIQWRMKDIP
jgi:hypothetical protein